MSVVEAQMRDHSEREAGATGMAPYGTVRMPVEGRMHATRHRAAAVNQRSETPMRARYSVGVRATDFLNTREK